MLASTACQQLGGVRCRPAGSSPVLEDTRTTVNTTLPGLLARRAAEDPGGVALREKEFGIWRETAWAGVPRPRPLVLAGPRGAGRGEGGTGSRSSATTGPNG